MNLPLVPFLASRFAAAPPRARALLVAGAGAAAILASLSTEPIVSTSGRASLVGLGLAILTWALRLREPPAGPGAPIDVADRRALSREAAVALLHVRGRALLVGYGGGEVRLIADLGPAEERGAP